MSIPPQPLSPTEVAGLLATWHPAEGEWCVNEVLGHLIEAEARGFAGRIRQILADVQAAMFPNMGNSRGCATVRPPRLAWRFLHDLYFTVKSPSVMMR